MYCDKFQEKIELATALRTAYNRIQELERQEQTAFEGWVKAILLSVCGNKEAVVKEVLNWTGSGEEDMEFKYNIIRAFEEEREERKIEGKIEAVLELLEEKGKIPDEIIEKIEGQSDTTILKSWLKLAAKVSDIKEFIEKM